MNNFLILRALTSPYGDQTKGAVLTHADVDNNFIFLKGQNILTGSSEHNNVTFQKANGETFSVKLKYEFTNVDTINDLDLITEDARTAGMVVGVSGGTAYYKLTTPPWNYNFSDWLPFSTGGGVGDYWTSGTSGNYSIRAYNNSGLDATGSYAVAEGNGTLAYGNSSHAEGYSTIASGTSAHAEGYNTKAIGDY